MLFSDQQDESQEPLDVVDTEELTGQCGQRDAERFFFVVAGDLNYQLRHRD